MGRLKISWPGTVVLVALIAGAVCSGVFGGPEILTAALTGAAVTAVGPGAFGVKP